MTMSFGQTTINKTVFRTCSLDVSEGSSASPQEGVSSGVVHVEMRPASEPRLSEDISGGSCDAALFLNGLPAGRTVP